MVYNSVYGIKVKDYLIYEMYFSSTAWVVARQEFRVELQFMLTDCGCDDEGHILLLKGTVLVFLVDRPIPGISSSCAVGLDGKCACCFHVSIKYTCGQQELFL